MKEPKDKRTKEYKEWKVKYGLGDLVADTIKTIAPKLAEKKKDCKPCNERKEWLNKLTLLRRTSVKRCMSEAQLTLFETYLNNRTEGAWTPTEVNYLITLYAWVFAIQYDQRKLCASCVGTGKILKGVHDKLNTVYQEQINDN